MSLFLFRRCSADFCVFFWLNFVLTSFVSTSNDVIFTFVTSFNNRSMPQQSCAERTNPLFATIFPRARRFFLLRETKDQRLRINATGFRPHTQTLKPPCQTSSFALGMNGFMTTTVQEREICDCTTFEEDTL